MSRLRKTPRRGGFIEMWNRDTEGEFLEGEERYERIGRMRLGKTAQPRTDLLDA
jgi:hypothetical protein